MHVVSTLKRGGIEVFVTELIRRSDPGRFRMSVCCLSECDGLGDVLRGAGAAVLYCPYKSPGVLTLLLHLSRLFRAEDVDVVHSHVGSFTVWVALAARLARVAAVVATYHNTYRYPHRRLSAAYLRVAKAIATRQVAVSHAVAEWLERYYGLRGLEVLYCGVDTGKFTPRAPEDVAAIREALGIPCGTRVVGTVCALSMQKDPRTFLRVAQTVVELLEAPVRFLVVGDGLMRAELESFARHLGLSGTVAFLGVRPDVELLMAVMDVFVLTSRWEGLPITLLEAQASGLPVVASRVPGVCEAVVEGETALLAEVGDASGFADHVLRILRDPELARSLGRAGRKLVLSRFGLEASVKRYQSLYCSLLGLEV
jgi:glycosyltransferase involved in cell wall biosynthesis